MRIISQNGEIDVPYEMTSIRSFEGNVLMNMVGDTGKGSVIARYSTPEKAQKAMKMLHGFYVRSQCNNRIFIFQVMKLWRNASEIV